MQGHFELNVRIPLIARNLLQSIALLSSTAVLFAEKCVDGHRGEPRGLRGLRGGHAGGRDRAQPVHRLRQGVRDRQGRRRERADAARGGAGARRGRGDARRGARPAQDRRGLSRVVTAGGTDAALLQRIEAYFDAAPRPAADVEQHGPLTLFVSRIPWRFYGRPRMGLSPRDAVRAEDVRALRARQRELGVREALEWVAETTPSLAEAAAAAGMAVQMVPLLAAPVDAIAAPAGVPGVTLRMLGADDPALVRVAGRGRGRVRRRAGHGGGARSVGFLRERIRNGITGVGVAEGRGGAVLGGGLPPAGRRRLRDQGVGVVPAQRGRGIGAALTALLAGDARASGADAGPDLGGGRPVARAVRARRLPAGGHDVLRRRARVTRAVAVVAAPGSRLRSAPVLALLGRVHDRVLGDPRAPGGRRIRRRRRSTGASTRCPCSATLAWREERRYGPRAAGQRRLALDRGALLRRGPGLLAPGDRRRRARGSRPCSATSRS